MEVAAAAIVLGEHEVEAASQQCAGHARRVGGVHDEAVRREPAHVKHVPRGRGAGAAAPDEDRMLDPILAQLGGPENPGGAAIGVLIHHRRVRPVHRYVGGGQQLGTGVRDPLRRRRPIHLPHPRRPQRRQRPPSCLRSEAWSQPSAWRAYPRSRWSPRSRSCRRRPLSCPRPAVDWRCPPAIPCPGRLMSTPPAPPRAPTPATLASSCVLPIGHTHPAERCHTGGAEYFRADPANSRSHVGILEGSRSAPLSMFAASQALLALKNW